MELHKMCRICLKNDLLVSIYSPTFLMRPADIIEKLHIFKLQEDDLPKMLCQSCLYRLLDAYNLQQLAETSERRLREFFGTCVNGSGGSENLLETGVVAAVEVRDMHIVLPASGSTNNGINSQLFTHYCGDTNAVEITTATTTTSAVGANDDLVNEVEIDVSSLTRSEPEDTLSEVFVGEQTSFESFQLPIQQQQQLEEQGVESNLLTDVLKLHTKDEINIAEDTRKKSSKSCKKQLKTPEKCLECGKIFKYSGYLTAHKRTHTGEKPYKCKICSRKFTQSSNLLLHERTHTGERRYQCELCANLFTTSSNLKTHRSTHTEQREFKCTNCTLTFKTLRALRRHEPKHKTHKDIICTLCDRAFVKLCYLNAHMANVHRGIKRHKCNECHKYFGNRSNLLCHMRIHTGERPFQCKLCVWKFNQSSALARHMKKHFKSATKFNPEVCNDAQAYPLETDDNYDFPTSVILDFSINNNKYV